MFNQVGPTLLISNERTTNPISPLTTQRNSVYIAQLKGTLFPSGIQVNWMFGVISMSILPSRLLMFY